jgi:uncharacterized membrane protein YfcA
MLIPVLGALLPVQQVPAALSIGTFTSSASRIVVFYKSIAWNIVKWFVPAAVSAVWLGAWLLKFVNPVYLEVGMGLFLISNLPFILKKTKDMDEVRQPKNYVLSLIGFTAGFLSGLTGAVGLLFNKFYLRYGLSKEQIVATRAANELILHLIKIVLYTMFGLISFKVISVGLVIAGSALISTYSMKWILPKLSDVWFKKIGYSAMVLSGFIMLGQSGNNILVANKGNISANPIAEGIETKLQWQNANYSLEYSYDDGFEFEQVVPITELSQEQQQTVLDQKRDADKIITEVVYGFGKTSFEAYYFKNHRLIGQIEFE